MIHSDKQIINRKMAFMRLNKCLQLNTKDEINWNI